MKAPNVKEQITDVLTSIVATADAELMALEEAELAAQWYDTSQWAQLERASSAKVTIHYAFHFPGLNWPGFLF